MGKLIYSLNVSAVEMNVDKLVDRTPSQRRRRRVAFAADA